MLGRFRVLSIVVCLWFAATPLYAANIQSAANGDWSSPTTWVGGVVPGPGDNVTVRHLVTLSTTVNITGTVTVNNAGQLVVAATGSLQVGTLSVSNSLVNRGSISATTQINVNPSATFTNYGDVTVPSLVMDNNSNVTNEGKMTITTVGNNRGTFTNNATLTVKGDFTNQGTMTIGPNGTMYVSGTLTNQNASDVINLYGKIILSDPDDPSGTTAKTFDNGGIINGYGGGVSGSTGATWINDGTINGTTYVCGSNVTFTNTGTGTVTNNCCFLLTANAGPDLGTCSSQPVIIGGSPAASSGTGPYTYVWSPAATLNNSTLANPTASPSATTTYTLTVTDSSTPSACVDQDQVTVSVGTALRASAGPDRTICTGSSVTIGGSPSASCGLAPYVYSWLPITNLSNPLSANPVASPTTTTQYVLLVTDGLSLVSRDTMVVYVSSPIPTANGGLDQEVCNAPTATVTATAPAVGTGQWSLVSGSGNIQNPNNLNTAVTGLVQGTTTVVRWTVTNGACSSFDDVNIVSYANPTDPDAGVDQSVCGSTTTMAGNTPTIGTGVWQIVTGTATITNPNSPTTTVTGLVANTTVSLRWRITNGTCPAKMDNVVLTIGALPTTPTLTTSGNLVCAGTNVTLTSSAAPNGGTYIWRKNGTIDATLTTQAIVLNTAAQSGSYTVAVRDGNAPNCTSAQSAAQVVSIQAIPANPTLSTSGNLVCAGTNVTLTSTAAPNGGTYIWRKNGTIDATLTTQAIILNTAAQSGSYTVTVRDGNAPNCTSGQSTAQVVTITALPATPTLTTSGNLVCAGTNVTLTSSAAPNGGTYIWYKNGTIDATLTTQSIVLNTAAQSGSYTVTVRDGAAPNCTSAQSAAQVVTITSPPATPTLTTSGNLVCAGTNVTLTSTVAPNGGTYIWRKNGIIDATLTTQSIVLNTAAQSGSYTVTVRDGAAPNCTSAQSTAQVVTITTPPATPTLNTSGNSVCVGTNVTLTSTAAPNGGTYTWRKNGTVDATLTTQSIVLNTAAQSGSYTVTVTDGTAPNCTSAQSAAQVVTITSPPATPTLTTSGNLVCVGTNVTLTSTAAPNGGTYTWRKNGTVDATLTTQSIVLNTAAQSGSYTVTVTDGTAPNCTSAQSTAQVVTITSPPTTPTLSTSGNLVCAGTNVTLTSTAAPNGGTYTWRKNGTVDATLTTQSIILNTAAQSGSYTVTVTDGTAPNCTSSQSTAQVVTITSPPATPTLTTSGNLVCAGTNVTLTSTAAPNGGTYTWRKNGTIDGTLTTQSVILNTAAQSGSYTVTVNDGAAPNCVSAQSTAQVVTITTPPATPTLTTSGNLVCAGTNVTLTSTAAPNGGTYTWRKNGTIDGTLTTQSIILNTAVQSGSYTVTVTDGAAPNCVSAQSAAQVVTITTPPATPTLTTSGNLVCAGTNVTLTSTAAPNGGTYTWRKNGTIDGTLTTPSIVLNTAAQSGSYTVTVTDGAAPNCVSAQSAAQVVTITTPPATPTLTTSGNLVCAGTNVTLTSTAAPNGGTYTWRKNGTIDGTLTTQSIVLNTAAQSGSYTVTVTDGAAPNCTSAQSTAQVVSITAPPTTPTLTTSGNLVCAGTNVTLTSTAAPNGGTYTWRKNGTIDGTLTTQSIILNTAAQSGSYTVTVADGAAPNCTSAQSTAQVVTITSPPTTPTLSTSGNIVCAGTNVTLTSTIAPNGGTYTWRKNGTIDGTLTTQSIILNTAAQSGSYTVTVTDGAAPNCVSAQSTAQVVTITTPPATPTLTTSGNLVCAGTNVTLTSTAAPNGGTYTWRKNGTIDGTLTTQSIILNTAAQSGSYTVTVTDGAAPNCTSAQSTAQVVTITTPPATPTLNASGNLVCAGTNVTLTSTAAPNGGTYTWRKNGTIDGTLTTQSIVLNTAAQSGSYTVTVTDGAAPNCTSAQSAAQVVTITSPPTTPTLTTSGNLVCVGTNVTLTSTAAPNGGTYTWRKNGTIDGTLTTQSIVLNTAAQSGSYTVTVTDGAAPNCTSAQSAAQVVTITSPPTTPTLTTSGNLVCVGTNVTLTSTAAPNGGTYTWRKNGTVDATLTTQSIVLNTAAQSGSYTVTVADGAAPNCTSAQSTTQVVSITSPPTTPTLTTSGNLVCAGTNVTLTSTAAPNGGTYTWRKNGTIDATLTTQSIILNTAAQSGSYTVTVIDGAAPNCTSAQSTAQVVSITTPPTTPTLTTSGNIVCAGTNVTLTSTAAPNGGTYTWRKNGTIDGTLTTQSIVLSTAAQSGSYTVTVIDGAAPNCTSAQSTAQVVNITSPPATPTLTTSGNVVCAGTNVTLTSTAAPNGGTYTWRKNGTIDATLTTQSIILNTAAQSGSYTVTVIDGAAPNCASAQSTAQVVSITSPPTTPTLTTSGNVVCAGTNVTLTSTIAPNGGTYTWRKNGTIDGTLTTQSIILNTAAQSGSYTVTVTDGAAPNCTSAQSAAQVVNITSPPTTPTLTTSGNIVCAGTNVTLTSTIAPNGGTYTWRKNGTIDATLTTQSIVLNTAAQSGSYTVTVIDGAAPNCTSAQSTAQVVSITSPPATPTLTTSGNVVCTGTNVTLTSTVAPNGGTYTWRKNGTVDATLTTQSIVLNTAAQSGSYTVTVTDGAAPNCTSAQSTAQVVTITSPPTTPTLSTSGNVVCAGTNVTLTSTAAPNGGTYTWRKNGTVDATLTTQSIVLNTAAQSGSYTVTVTDGAAPNCTSVQSAAQVVTIQPAPAAPTLSTSGNVVCAGTNVTLTSTVAPNGGTYTWYKNGTIDASLTGQSIVLNTAAQSGSYAVAVIDGTAPNCTSTQSTTQLVSITSPPAMPTLTTSGNVVCAGTNVTLTSTAAPNGGTYTWRKNGTVDATLTTQIIVLTTAAQSGSYTVTVTDGAAPNCTSVQSAAQVVSITTPPTTPSLSTSGNVVCAGTNVTLTSTAAPNSGTYTWYKNGTLDATLTTQTIVLNSAAQSGSYTVTVTDGTAPNCTSTQSAAQAVTIQASPATPTLTTSGNVVCAGTNVTLTSTAAPNGGTYTWYKNGTLDATLTTQSIVLNAAGQSGNYTVTVTDGTAPNCTSAQSTAQVVSITSPPATPTLTTSGNVVCAGTNVTLTSTAAPNGGTYSWRKNGTIDATLTTQSIVLNTAVQSGSYTVTVVDGAAPNCTSVQSTAQVVTIQTAPTAPTVTTSGNNVCAGTNVTLTSTAAPNGGTYTWYKNGTIDATLTTQSIVLSTAAQSGSYTSTVTDGAAPNCTSTQSAAQVVTIQASPTTPTLTTSGNTVCAGTNVTLTSTAAPNGGSYTWYRNGTIDATLTGQSIVLSTAAQSGSYTVTVTNGVAPNCTSTQSAAQVVTIQTAPALPTLATSGNNVCAGTNVTLTSTAAPNGGTYTWRKNGTIDATLTTQSIVLSTAAQSGTYTVTVTDGTPPNCTSPQSTSQVVTIQAIPATPTISTSGSTVCEGTNVVLTSSAAPVGGTYTWYKNGAVVAALTSQSITLSMNTASGDYQVAVGNGSCSSLQSNIETVSIATAPSTAQAGADQVLCNGETFTTLTAVAPTVGTGVWSVVSGGGLTFSPNINDPQATVSGINGSATLRWTVSTSAACFKTDDVVITSSAVPTIAPAAATLCAGESVQLVVTGGNSFAWSPSTGLSSASISNPVATPASTTTYNVTVGRSNCPDRVLQVVVTVNPLPTVSVTPNTAALTAGGSIQLQATGATTYLWTPSTGLDDASIADPIASPPATTTYTVTGTDASNCSATATAVITVDDAFEIFIPEMFSPNQDQSNDVLFVNTRGVEQFEFKVYDRTGKEIFTTNDSSQGWDGTYNGTLQKMDTYVYFISAKAYSGQQVTKRGSFKLVR